MSIEAQKSELISKIAVLQDTFLLKQLQSVFDQRESNQTNFKRKAGWGKGIFTNISDDFDNFIPPGFEEYLPTEDQMERRPTERRPIAKPTTQK